MHVFPFLIPLSYGFMNLSKLILSFMKKSPCRWRKGPFWILCAKEKNKFEITTTVVLMFYAKS